MTRVASSGGTYVDLTWGSNGKVSNVRDPAGNNWGYAYNTSGMLSRVTSPGADYRYSSTDPTLLTEVWGGTINNGVFSGVRRFRYEYYADRRAKSSGDENNERRDLITYSGNATTLTDSRGQASTYTFAIVKGNLNLVSVSRATTPSCPSAVATIGYDGNGFLDYEVDWRGNRTEYTYDSAGRMLNKTTAHNTTAAQTQVNTWSGEELLSTTFKGSDGSAYRRVNYLYYLSSDGKVAGRLKRETWTDLKTTSTPARQIDYSYVIDSYGRLSSVTTTRVLSAGNESTTSTYDTAGNLIAFTNSLNQQVTWTGHTAFGSPGSYYDLNGVETRYTYNEKGRLTQQSYMPSTGTRATTYAYDYNGQVTSITHPTGRIDRFQYASNGRLKASGNALNEYVDIGIDMAVNQATTTSSRKLPTWSSNNTGGTVSGEFSSVVQSDSLGRPYNTYGNGGQEVALRYDKNGNLTSRRDNLNHTRTYTYDAQNRVLTEAAPDGGAIALTYHPEGTLKSVTDPRNLVTSYTYNGFGDLLTQTSPDTGKTTYTYNAAGRLTTMTLANAVSITYMWDKLDRLRSRTSDGVTESYTYDSGTNGLGRLTKLTDGSGTITFAYAPDGQITSQVNTILSTEFTTNWSYYADGQLSGMVYPIPLHTTSSILRKSMI